MERLGVGELTMHFRYGSGRPLACGIGGGCVTGVEEDITCQRCREVKVLADRYAEECGCRFGDVHRAVALAIIEMRIDANHGKGISSVHPR